MAILKKSVIIDAYNANQTVLLDDEGEIRYSKNQFLEASKRFSTSIQYDIFISHSYDDARAIRHLRDLLVGSGYKVYVDWIEDKLLDRTRVSTRTAETLRERMKSCKSLLYITSVSAEKSVWMPWELGYMDAKTGRVAVAPILDDDEDFDGQEYLGLYPYLDLTNDIFYIHTGPREWINFNNWMLGENPIKHS